MKEIPDWLEPFRKMWEGRFNELDKVLKILKNQKSMILTIKSHDLFSQ